VFKQAVYHKPVLTQEVCTKMIEAVVRKAEKLGIRINVAIMDGGANLKAFLRMDEAPLLSSVIAQNKAYTAASFGLATHAWYPMIEKEPALLHGIVHTDRLVVFGGGLPIKYKEHLLGGIGVSGGTAEEDVICAQAGIDAFTSLAQVDA
jgi:uncharacterized protein GlcG (DUF336 family)